MQALIVKLSGFKKKKTDSQVEEGLQWQREGESSGYVGIRLLEN